jgi:hypothetical protein
VGSLSPWTGDVDVSQVACLKLDDVERATRMQAPTKNRAYASRFMCCLPVLLMQCY